jgi:hypothetical protein
MLKQKRKFHVDIFPFLTKNGKMNLANVHGKFSSALQLLREIVKESLKFDYELLTETDNDLVYKHFKISFKQTTSMLKIIVNSEIIQWKLDDVLSEVEFPLEVVKGNLKDFVKREDLSLKLSEFRTIISKLVSAPAPSETVPEPQHKMKVEQGNSNNVQMSQEIDDPIEINSGYREFSGIPASQTIGNADLDPFAGSRGFVGIGPISGMRPGGGMVVGPDHPMFSNPGRLGRPPVSPFGPPQFPPGAVPPGARFDPVLPFGPNSIPRPGTGPGFGRGSRMPFSGDPDFDEYLPPGGDPFI